MRGLTRGLAVAGLGQARVLSLSSASLLLALTVLALIRPVISYDSWWYHLPFSSYLWNIGGGMDSFVLDRTSYYRWLGFPKFWEWTQGLFWSVGGSLNFVIIPQLVICIFYFYYSAHIFSIPISYIVLSFFS